MELDTLRFKKLNDAKISSKKESAAVRFQAVVRGKLGMRAVERRRVAYLVREGEERAAIIIARVFRGRRGRRKAERAKKACLILGLKNGRTAKRCWFGPCTACSCSPPRLQTRWL